MPKARARSTRTETQPQFDLLRSPAVIIGIIALIGVGITTLNHMMPWPTTATVNAELEKISNKLESDQNVLTTKIDENAKLTEEREQAIKESINDINNKVEKLDTKFEKLNDSVTEMKANAGRASDEVNHGKHYSD